jgi:hypothetical protein
MPTRAHKWMITLSLLAALLHASAVRGQTGAPEEPPAPGVETPSPDWQRELDAIADLLIDGRNVEAQEKASALLSHENLPEEVARRAKELQQKAEAKLASPSPATEISIKPAEPARETEPNEREFAEKSFTVRLAQVGRGFIAGTSGSLRISETGLSFLRKGQKREDWVVPWSDLAEAREDDGLWDTPYPPIAIVERGGRKHFVARIDAQGRYLPSVPMLSAITASRGKKAVPQQKPGDKEPGTVTPREGS